MKKYLAFFYEILKITPVPNAGIAQLVERNLAKIEVASSRLVSRSRFLKGALGYKAPFFVT